MSKEFFLPAYGLGPAFVRFVSLLTTDSDLGADFVIFIVILFKHFGTSKPKVDFVASFFLFTGKTFVKATCEKPHYCQSK